MSDSYVSGTCRWWHLSAPSPELLAAEADGWLGAPGIAVDLGCGLGTEAHYLATKGWSVLGMDLSGHALARAAAQESGASFVRADVLAAPVRDHCADLVLDRGCFHYLAPEMRAAYATEVSRALRPSGRLFLRACLAAAGRRNDIDIGILESAFEGWAFCSVTESSIASDTRHMPALICRLRPPVSRAFPTPA